MALLVCLIAGFSTTVFWPLDLDSPQPSSECNHYLLMSWRIQEADSKYISKNAKQFIQIAGLETSNTMSCIDLHPKVEKNKKQKVINFLQLTVRTSSF